MSRRSLLFALVLLGAGGFLLHYRIHPFLITDKATGAVSFDGTKFLASLAALVDVFVVTLLFRSRRTALYGYLLNGMLVILGTVLMTHFSIAYFMAKGVPPGGVIINSMLPDIAIAWADFMVGRALYEKITETSPLQQ